jgi:hypothetical protein
MQCNVHVEVDVGVESTKPQKDSHTWDQNKICELTDGYSEAFHWKEQIRNCRRN